MASSAPTFPSTRETTNYARLCRLLVDFGSQALRERFDIIHPPGGLETVLATPPALPQLQYLQVKKILNPFQWDKLYPAIKSSVSSKNFDITLLMVLLRNICGHSAQALVDDATFHNYWKNIRCTVVRLGGVAYEAAIDGLTYDCLDPELEEHYKEFLKKWKRDEDSVMDKLINDEAKVDKVVPAVDIGGGS